MTQLIYEARRKLIDNVIYQLLYDAVAIGSGEYEKVRADRGGSKRWSKNLSASRLNSAYRMKSEILRDLHSDRMLMFFSWFGWQEQIGTTLIKDLLNGKRLDEGRRLMKDLKHAPRIYQHRGVGVIKARKEEQARQQTTARGQNPRPTSQRASFA